MDRQNKSLSALGSGFGGGGDGTYKKHMSSLLEGICICRRDMSLLSFLWGSQTVRILLDIALLGVRKIRQRQSMEQKVGRPRRGQQSDSLIMGSLQTLKSET